MTSGVLAVVPLPLILVGPQECIVFANDRDAAVFSKPLNNQHYISVLRQPMLLDAIENAFRSGKPQEAVYLGHEGTRETTYLARAVPVSLDAGTAVLVSFEDQTAMQDAGSMRRDFVANVSHELRTPLTALLGFIETIRGPARDNSAAQERFLGIMRDECERMNRLVQDLLSLSRVEGGERQRPTNRVDMAGLLRSAVTSLQPAASLSGVDIAVVIDHAPAPV